MCDFKVGDAIINNQGSEFTIIEYKNSRHVLIEFNDEHKYRYVVRAYTIKTKNVRNPFYPSASGVGYIGVGEFSSSVDNIGREAYVKWQAMLLRCYEVESDESRNPSYADCTVHRDWHNFQNFAKWCVYQKYYNSGYEIDKDILVTGNRVYSEDSCCLVPAEINQMAIKLRHIGVNKSMGVSYDEKSRKYIAITRMGREQKYIGSYRTLQEASDAYVDLKKRYFKNMAIVHKERLDIRVIRALWFWEELKDMA